MAPGSKWLYYNGEPANMSNPTNTFNLVRLLRWNRTSYLLLSSFFVLLILIGYVWWPLLEAYLATYNPSLPFWLQFDWLLLGDFLVMTLLIMADANLRKDLPIIAIGFAGGLVIEAWGTQTWLWSYYTLERPPLWIIPAWPIASLSIDRLFRFLRRWTRQLDEGWFRWAYWLVFAAFMAFMLPFVAVTLDKSLTVMAVILCLFLILTPGREHRPALLTFIAGSALGYFLELWGTTRMCWIYYTGETPPIFAVLAHGMAAVAFWRVFRLYEIMLKPRMPAWLTGEQAG